MTTLINTSPKYYGGLQNGFSFKGFQLDVFIQFVKQIGPKIFFNNLSNHPGSFTIYGGSNQPIYVLDRWQKPGDISLIQRYSNYLDYTKVSTSDFNYEDASFLRLKNLTLSWQLPNGWKQKACMKDVRIYLQAQNLLTFTNFKGFDPESVGNGSAIPAMSLPSLKMLTVGLQAVF